jgi:hypothetical protein
MNPKVSYDSARSAFESAGTDTMPLTIAEAREALAPETDLADLLREFEIVQQEYQENVRAMSLDPTPPEPVASSASVTICVVPMAEMLRFGA